MLAALCSSACGGPSNSDAWYESPEAVRHPLHDSLTSSQHAGILVTHDTDAAYWRELEPSEIGHWTATGNPVDAELVPGTGLLVLDAGLGGLRLLTSDFDQPGRVVPLLGLADPSALFRVDSVTFGVTDRQTASLTLLRLRDGVLDVAATLRLGLLHPVDGCRSESGVVVFGLARASENGTALPEMAHVHDSSGWRAHSFARPYGYDGNLDVASILNIGSLACRVEGALTSPVWVAFGALGEVHAFAADGTLTRVFKFEGLRFPPFVEVPGRVSGLVHDEKKSMEYISNIIVSSDSTLAVQVTSATPHK